MYPYNTNNDHSKRSIKAARKEFPEPLSNNDSMSQLFSNAMADESRDAVKYRNMMDYFSKNGLADLSEVAKSMYADESKHKMMLQTMADENGIEYNMPEESEEGENDFSPEGLLKNVASEIEGARFYRDFARVLRNENVEDMAIMYELMNDEQNHAVLNDYLYLRTLAK